jgi:hypothetical protein
MPPDEPRVGGGSPSADRAWIHTWLATAQQRWRLALVTWHLVVGMAVGRLVHACVSTYGGSAMLPAGAAGACVTVAGLLATRGLRSLTPLITETEAHTPTLGNALRTWHELGSTLDPSIETHLTRQVRGALGAASWPRPVSVRRWRAALLALALAAMAPWWLPAARPAQGHGSDGASNPATGGGGSGIRWHVTVRPPAYSRQSVQELDAPTRIEALAGARLDVRVEGWPAGAQARLGATPLVVETTGTTARATFDVHQSDALVLGTATGTPLATIVVIVRADADLKRAAATGQVSIHVVAADDIGLRELRLRYTKVSGSGESFTFEDGEWPVRLQRRSPTTWEGDHVVELAALGLGPGDSVAYHAVAHDARPGAEGAGESERFLIEIAREGAQAAGDFSLPEPEEKFALSQRMVILLTERLLERRPRMTAAAYLSEAQALAIAQRRVRAEFVFMLGGEVEDEEEEAAHSHEVEAGRLDNRGQGDLTTAVRQMAQAETRLTDADLREALPYEYRALAALQAAFGKARYFMRTLPTPVQLDGARRLQGDRSEAAPARWARAPLPEPQARRALALLARLDSGATTVAAAVPDLIALDRADGTWVQAVQGAAAGSDGAAAARLLRARLLASGTARVPLPLPASRDEVGLAALERRP